MVTNSCFLQPLSPNRFRLLSPMFCLEDIGMDYYSRLIPSRNSRTSFRLVSNTARMCLVSVVLNLAWLKQVMIWLFLFLIHHNILQFTRLISFFYPIPPLYRTRSYISCSLCAHFLFNSLILCHSLWLND